MVLSERNGVILIDRLNSTVLALRGVMFESAFWRTFVKTDTTVAMGVTVSQRTSSEHDGLVPRYCLRKDSKVEKRLQQIIWQSSNVRASLLLNCDKLNARVNAA